MINVTCPACGGKVIQSGRGRPRIYCSAKCGRWGLRHLNGSCSAEGCTASHMARGYCGKHYNEWLDEHNPLRCSEPDCDRGVRAKGLCAMHWRRRARAEGREVADPWSERRKANWKRRESLKRGADGAESFSYAAVFERDGWICGLCDEPVDPDIKWPDLLSVSLDHVVPLSAGGSHSPDNAQCAHLSCNVRKGAQPIA